MIGHPLIDRASSSTPTELSSTEAATPAASLATSSSALPALAIPDATPLTMSPTPLASEARRPRPFDISSIVAATCSVAAALD